MNSNFLQMVSAFLIRVHSWFDVPILIRDIRSLPAVAGNPRPATPEALAKAGLQKISKFPA